MKYLYIITIIVLSVLFKVFGLALVLIGLIEEGII